MAAWRNLRDLYRKKILNPGKPGGRGGGGGSKKSGSKGASLGEQQETWKFYERMSFYKPYIYMNKYCNPFHDIRNPCHDTRNLFHNKVKCLFNRNLFTILFMKHNLFTDRNNPFCDNLIQISVALSCLSMTYKLECYIFISTVLSQTWQRSNLTKKTEKMTTLWWLQPHLQAPEN